MEVFEKNSNIFSLLSEAVSEGVIVVDSAQSIVATNKSADDMFGYGKEELLGKFLDILIPKKYQLTHTKHVDKFMDNGKKRRMGHDRELYGQRQDGSIFPVEAGLNPFVIYGQKYVMALVIDITERKAQREEILALNAHLEQKIDERTKTLDNTIKDLQKEAVLRKKTEERLTESLKKEKELSELKTKFLSLVSHEFKTPLTGMLSSVALASRYLEKMESEKIQKHLDIIRSKIKYLNNILNDFLSVESLSSGKVTYTMTDFQLCKVINEVVYDANMLLKEGQKIRFPKHIDQYTISFDEKTLELALTNLISNGIKYSPEHSNIELDIMDDENFIFLEVRDQGIGIPQKEQKFIFDRYYRADNALTNAGTGIGLNIAKNHLENLGGLIEFESEIDVGSIFRIKIPKNKVS